MYAQNVYYNIKHETCTKGGVNLNNKLIARKLIELRGNKSRETVANACGISVSALAMYEQGERIPRDDIKIKLAKYYKRSVNYIFLLKKSTKRARKFQGIAPNDLEVKIVTWKYLLGLFIGSLIGQIIWILIQLHY